MGFTKYYSLTTAAKLADKVPEGKIDLNFVENVDSVIQFFNQLGFQQSDIRKIACREPRILVSRVSETLKPKIKILNDLGIFGSDLVEVILINPSILFQNLGPAIQAYKTVLGSDGDVVTVLKQSSGISFDCAAKYLIPNVNLLQNYCVVPTEKIQNYIIQHPKSFAVRTDLFRDMLVKVEVELKIPRGSSMFLYGFHMMTRVSDKHIEDRCEVFKSFGWTQADVMRLIKQNPLCLCYTKARIEKRLDFLMNQQGYEPFYLSLQPLLFICSLEKRLLPRLQVIQILKEKGFLRRNYHLSSAIGMTDSMFFKRFVRPFEVVHEVYAQMTGSTLGSLFSRGQTFENLPLSRSAGT
uniref:Uncharacterized protein n=1 Tax=Chenopodium quinoa TaxID=63459 RepID=A0A803MI14_CHEQI